MEGSLVEEEEADVEANRIFVHYDSNSASSSQQLDDETQIETQIKIQQVNNTKRFAFEFLILYNREL